VRFARLVLHAALAGVYGGIVVALFLLLGNPAAAAGGEATLAATLLPVIFAYTLAAAIAWPLLYAGLRFFASHPLRLEGFSLRYLMGFHVANAGVILYSGWTTLSRFRKVLDPAAIDRLAATCLALSLAWAFAAVVTLVPRLRRGFWPQATAAALALAALLVAGRSGRPPASPPGPVAAEAPGRVAPPARRLVLLNFDGADLDTVLTLQAQGKLPAFSRLSQEGAYGRLRSLVPCEAAVTRTTLVTGKLPYRHGVQDGQARRFFNLDPWIQVAPVGIGFDFLQAPFLERRTLAVTDRTSLALWEIVALAGGAGDAAGWEIDPDEEGTPGRVAPGSGPPPAWLQDFMDPEAIDRNDPLSRALILEIARALEADARIMGDLERLLGEGRPGVAALSFPGLDRVAHHFLRYTRPGDFGNVSEREIDLYGKAMEGYYRRIDGIIGTALDAGGEGMVLFVTSSHGMDPVPLRERLWPAAGRGAPRSGTHEEGPDGFLFARGPGTRRGLMLGKGSIADAVPTALYALGLPLARDLDGSILTGAFEEAYTFENPVTVIRSYEAGR
jgi:hypothetical protein